MQDKKSCLTPVIPLPKVFHSEKFQAKRCFPALKNIPKPQNFENRRFWPDLTSGPISLELRAPTGPVQLVGKLDTPRFNLTPSLTPEVIRWPQGSPEYFEKLSFWAHFSPGFFLPPLNWYRWIWICPSFCDQTCGSTLIGSSVAKSPLPVGMPSCPAIPYECVLGWVLKQIQRSASYTYPPMRYRPY